YLADAALPLHRLDEDRRRLGSDRLLDRFDVAEGHLVEAVRLRPETFQVLRLPAGRDGRQGAAVEGAFEGDGAEALGVSADVVMTPRGLDRAFQRLGAGIGEEYLVGEAVRHKTLGKARLAGYLVEIGN